MKNSQEAHEAIRPTDIRRLPCEKMFVNLRSILAFCTCDPFCHLEEFFHLLSAMLVGVLDDDSLKLYTLIWARTLSCQMEQAKLEQV